MNDSPIKICAMPRGVHHLADVESDVAWCGAVVNGCVSFELEPGSDFGERDDDCRRCVAIRRKDSGL